jgi:hypothetical protein
MLPPTRSLPFRPVENPLKTSPPEGSGCNELDVALF